MQGLSVTARWAELDSCLAQLVAGANTMRQLCQAEEHHSHRNIRDFLVPTSAPIKAHSIRENMVATLGKLQVILAQPAEFLAQLAMQVLLFAPNLLLVSGTESCVLLAESDARLPALAGPIPNSSLHPPSRQHCLSGYCRTCGRARVSTSPNHSYDSFHWISLRASSRLCGAHCTVSAFREHAVLSRCTHVLDLHGSACRDADG